MPTDPDWATRASELEAMRTTLHRLVDGHIDNRLDDGREGGSISEGDMPTAGDFLMELYMDWHATEGGDEC